MTKKLSAILAFLLVSNQAFAATSGSSVGIDFVNSRVNFHEKAEYDDSSSLSGRSVSNIKPSDVKNDNYGVGLSYSYAFNFGGPFIAPKIIAEYANVDIESQFISRANQTRVLQIDGRAGVGFDLGYDIGNYFSPYLTAGAVAVKYSTRNYSINDTPSYGTKNSFAPAFFYGLGFRVNLTKNLHFKTEYNFQKFSAETTENPIGGDNLDSKFVTRYDVLKAGFNFNF